MWILVLVQVMIWLFPARCWAGWFSNQNEQRSLVLHLLVRVSWATVSDPSRSVIKPILTCKTIQIHGPQRKVKVVEQKQNMDKLCAVIGTLLKYLALPCITLH